MVGRDILIGIVCAVLVRCLAQLDVIVAAAGLDLPSVRLMSISSGSLSGARHATGELLKAVLVGLESGLFIMLLVDLLRTIARSRRLAVVAFVILLSVVFTIRGGHPQVSWLFASLAFSLIGLLVLHYGLLSLIALIFTYELLRFPMTADPRAWFFEIGLTAVLAVLAIAAGAVYFSSSGVAMRRLHSFR